MEEGTAVRQLYKHNNLNTTTMRKQRFFKLAVVALMTMGAIAAVSCKKDDGTNKDSSDKVVKGITCASIGETEIFKISGNDTVRYILSDIYDISVEVVAGTEKKSGTLTGNTLRLEAATTTIPSNGKITATVTPKQSFLDGIDTTKQYYFFVIAIHSYDRMYGDGFTRNSTKAKEVGGVVYGIMNGSDFKWYITDFSSDIAEGLGNGTTYEFKDTPQSAK